MGVCVSKAEMAAHTEADHKVWESKARAGGMWKSAAHRSQVGALERDLLNLQGQLDVGAGAAAAGLTHEQELLRALQAEAERAAAEAERSRARAAETEQRSQAQTADLAARELRLHDRERRLTEIERMLETKEVDLSVWSQPEHGEKLLLQELHGARAALEQAGGVPAQINLLGPCERLLSVLPRYVLEKLHLENRGHAGTYMDSAELVTSIADRASEIANSKGHTLAARLRRRTVSNLREATVRTLFATIDKDGNNELDGDEVRQVFAAAGVTLTDEDVAEAMAVMDVDRSGTVDADEFTRWINSGFGGTDEILWEMMQSATSVAEPLLRSLVTWGEERIIKAMGKTMTPVEQMPKRDILVGLRERTLILKLEQEQKPRHKQDEATSVAGAAHWAEPLLYRCLSVLHVELRNFPHEEETVPAVQGPAYGEIVHVKHVEGGYLALADFAAFVPISAPGGGERAELLFEQLTGSAAGEDGGARLVWEPGHRGSTMSTDVMSDAAKVRLEYAAGVVTPGTEAATTVLQSAIRRKLATKTLQRSLKAAVLMQSSFRGLKVRQEHAKQDVWLRQNHGVAMQRSSRLLEQSAPLSDFQKQVATRRNETEADTAALEAKAAFKVFDTSGDGLLDASEFQALMGELGEPVTMLQAQDLLKDIDLDNSGEIDLAEFSRWWQSKGRLIKQVIRLNDQARPENFFAIDDADRIDDLDAEIGDGGGDDWLVQSQAAAAEISERLCKQDAARAR